MEIFGECPDRSLTTKWLRVSLNVSECVDDCSQSMRRGLRLYEALLFARDLLKNDEEISSVSASIDELQTARN